MTTQKQTTLIQWNLNGFRGKLSELQMLVRDYNPLAFALQETLLNTDPPNQVLSNRYAWYTKPDQDHPGKNGVALGIRKDIPHTRIMVNRNNIQIVAATLETPTKITIASLYLSSGNTTKQNEQNTIKDIIEISKQLPRSYIIAGDLNAHSPLWGSYKTNTRGDILEYECCLQNWKILNNGSPTRIDPTTGNSSAIDLTIGSADLPPLVVENRNRYTRQ